VLILDLEARDLTEVFYRMVEELSMAGVVDEEHKSEVLRVLLFRHNYVSAESAFSRISGGLRKNLSSKSLHVSRVIDINN
jgi:hypothetical protein